MGRDRSARVSAVGRSENLALDALGDAADFAGYPEEPCSPSRRFTYKSRLNTIGAAELLIV